MLAIMILILWKVCLTFLLVFGVTWFIHENNILRHRYLTAIGFSTFCAGWSCMFLAILLMIWSK